MAAGGLEVAGEVEAQAAAMQLLGDRCGLVGCATLQQGLHHFVQTRREVKADLGAEVERRGPVRTHARAAEHPGNRWGAMHGPGGGVAAAFEDVAPLAKAALLAGVDLLAAPLRDALGELDEMLGLGPGRGGVGRGGVTGVLAADLVGVPGALRLGTECLRWL